MKAAENDGQRGGRLDNGIELRREREPRKIGNIPPPLLIWGWTVIAIILICLTAGYVVWHHSFNG